MKRKFPYILFLLFTTTAWAQTSVSDDNELRTALQSGATDVSKLSTCQLVNLFSFFAGKTEVVKIIFCIFAVS